MPTAINQSELIDLSSEKDTEELAKIFLKKLKPGYSVFLYGEMGVGKTTFIRYLINGFQKKNKINITEVTSPTFNLLNEYQINRIKINHYDLFRINSEIEIKKLDLFEDTINTINLIEWPQMIKRKPKRLIELTLNYKENYNKRFAQIKGLNL